MGGFLDYTNNTNHCNQACFGETCVLNQVLHSVLFLPVLHINYYMLVSVIYLTEMYVNSLNSRARKFLGCTGILVNVQGKIGALYRDSTQIGWQVCIWKTVLAYIYCKIYAGYKNIICSSRAELGGSAGPLVSVCASASGYLVMKDQRQRNVITPQRKTSGIFGNRPAPAKGQHLISHLCQ